MISRLPRCSTQAVVALRAPPPQQEPERPAEEPQAQPSGDTAQLLAVISSIKQRDARGLLSAAAGNGGGQAPSTLRCAAASAGQGRPAPAVPGVECICLCCGREGLQAAGGCPFEVDRARPARCPLDASLAAGPAEGLNIILQSFRVDVGSKVPPSY